MLEAIDTPTTNVDVPNIGRVLECIGIQHVLLADTTPLRVSGVERRLIGICSIGRHLYSRLTQPAFLAVIGLIFFISTNLITCL